MTLMAPTEASVLKECRPPSLVDGEHSEENGRTVLDDVALGEGCAFTGVLAALLLCPECSAATELQSDRMESPPAALPETSEANVLEGEQNSAAAGSFVEWQQQDACEDVLRYSKSNNSELSKRMLMSHEAGRSEACCQTEKPEIGKQGQGPESELFTSMVPPSRSDTALRGTSTAPPAAAVATHPQGPSVPQSLHVAVQGRHGRVVSQSDGLGCVDVSVTQTGSPSSPPHLVLEFTADRRLTAEWLSIDSAVLRTMLAGSLPSSVKSEGEQGRVGQIDLTFSHGGSHNDQASTGEEPAQYRYMEHQPLTGTDVGGPLPDAVGARLARTRPPSIGDTGVDIHV